MKIRASYRLVVAAALVSTLVACGGGSNVDVTDTATDAGRASAFATAYANALVALNTTAGLTDSKLIDLFDDTYLDGGVIKTTAATNFKDEAAALTATPDLSLYPMVKLSNVTMSGCTTANVCNMTATVTNADADTTSFTFTTRVLYSGGKFRLLGDGLSA